jgi:hypothetical protein
MRSGIILTAVSILMVVGIAHAGGSGIFDNGSISGTYVVSLSGHGQGVQLPPDPNSNGPIQGVVGIGLLTFDGNGSITAGSILINANGDFGHVMTMGVNPLAGSNSVSADGTCTISIPVDPFNNVLQTDWNCVVESPDKVVFNGQPVSTSLYSLTEGTLTKQQGSDSHHHH